MPTCAPCCSPRATVPRRSPWAETARPLDVARHRTTLRAALRRKAVDDLQLIKVAVADHVALVTMDAPPVNAQGRRFNEEMSLAFDRIAERDDIRCAVLTGAGKIFSAGADLKDRAAGAAARQPGDGLQHLRRGRGGFKPGYESRQPGGGAGDGAGRPARPA